jgi:predicted MarR family transcription regulator
LGPVQGRGGQCSRHHIDDLQKNWLASLGLVHTGKRGKEVLYSINEKESFALSELARFLRVLSGLYDQAARSATSM